MQTFDEQRRTATRRALAYGDIRELSIGTMLENLKRAPLMTRTMMQLSPSSSVKYSVGRGLFTSVIQSHGTARHFKFLEQAEEGEVRQL